MERLDILEQHEYLSRHLLVVVPERLEQLKRLAPLPALKSTELLNNAVYMLPLD